jgi:hypothetical protein
MSGASAIAVVLTGEVQGWCSPSRGHCLLLFCTPGKPGTQNGVGAPCSGCTTPAPLPHPPPSSLCMSWWGCREGGDAPLPIPTWPFTCMAPLHTNRGCAVLLLGQHIAAAHPPCTPSPLTSPWPLPITCPSWSCTVWGKQGGRARWGRRRGLHCNGVCAVPLICRAPSLRGGGVDKAGTPRKWGATSSAPHLQGQG